MKKLLTLCLSLLACTYGHSQTTIYSQSFNSGSASDWSLNTADVGGTTASTDNKWIINNAYAGGMVLTTPIPATPDEPSSILGYPESYYMHIYSSLGVGFGGPANDNFDAIGSGEIFTATLNTPQVTTGYTNVYFSFWWICQGDATSNGGLYYRTSASGTWTAVTGVNFYGSSIWSVDSVHLAAFDNQAYLQFAFTFTDGSGVGSDPAFGVDQITLTGEGGTSGAPIASFTTTATASCQDSCITFTSTSAGSPTGYSWSVAPSGSSSVATPSADNTQICFSAGGTYTVTLTATNGSGANSSSNVINITPTPHPTITQSGGVLSIPAAYTTYQWYNGLSPVAGATTNSYTIIAPGIYGVLVDSAGCTGGDTINVISLHVGNVNTISAAHYWIAQENSSININSSTPLADELSITIFDLTGREILNEKWDAGSYTKRINGLSVASGLYVIKLSNNYNSSVIKWRKL